MIPMAKFVVRKVNANGRFSKARPSRFDFTHTVEMALWRKEELEKANPHIKYGIDTL